jgi:anthranilate/para-aminobenzoate synthase component I
LTVGARLLTLRGVPRAPLALRLDPVAALARLAAEPGATLLAVPDPARPVTLVGCAPAAELRLTAGMAGDPLLAIERFVAASPRPEPELPFPLGGGIVACLAYELGIPTVRPRGVASLPPGALLAVLRRYDPWLVHDATTGAWHIVGSTPERLRPPWLARLATPPPTVAGPLARGPLVPLVSPAAYRLAVRRILRYLRAGDVYQVNLTLPFAADLAAPPWALCARLAARHPVPYTAYLDLGDAAVVMNSPELLLRRRGRRVETRPIKGTRPRGTDAARDAALAAELVRDPKERAEHVMIVDLERNDLGRVCEVGSVTVDELAAVERHPSVLHLVSTITGRLAAEVGLAGLLRATFPGGSITGAPKERAMAIIAELEPLPRGVYTGALGLVDPRGDLELGLPIRTAVVTGGRLCWHAGGGIVLDSDPDRELAEAWLKTAALRWALGEAPAALDPCSSG